jgi:hypothetical protein
MMIERDWLLRMGGGSNDAIDEIRRLLERGAKPSAGFRARAVTKQALPAFTADVYQGALAALDKVRENRPLGEDERKHLETVVLGFGRPALMVRGDQFAAPQLSCFNEVWEHRALLAQALRATVRIDTPGHPLIPYCGTGTVIGPNIVLTNGHVVTHGIGRWNGERWTIPETLKARVDFDACEGGEGRQTARIVEILFVHDVLDVAVVRIEETPAQPPAVRVISELPAPDPSQGHGTLCVTVGHPAMDVRVPLHVQMRVFEGTFNVKRVAPGFITGVLEDGRVLSHDCSTLGGNSGSGLFVLAGGMCGLHFGGEYEDTNWAVSLPMLGREPRLSSWLA